MRSFIRGLLVMIVIGLGLSLGGLLTPGVVQSRPQAAHIIYADALANSWGDWSWNTTVNLNNTAPARGTHSIAATFTARLGRPAIRPSTGHRSQRV